MTKTNLHNLGLLMIFTHEFTMKIDASPFKRTGIDLENTALKMHPSNAQKISGK
jgi:hypothetical protein